MNSDLIFIRTSKGQEELDTWKYKLPAALRRVLILVDGRSTVAELHEKALVYEGLESSLEQLSRDSFIKAGTAADGNEEKTPQGDQAGLKWQLVDLAREVLGNGGADKVSKKLLTAADTHEGLHSAVENCGKLIRLTISEAKAEKFLDLGRKMIADHYS